MYVKRSTVGILFLTLYVDDILLAGNNLEMIEAIKRWLSSVFEMKDMGEARYVLGVEIVRNHPKETLRYEPRGIYQKGLGTVPHALFQARRHSS